MKTTLLALLITLGLAFSPGVFAAERFWYGDVAACVEGSGGRGGIWNSTATSWKLIDDGVCADDRVAWASGDDAIFTQGGSATVIIRDANQNANRVWVKDGGFLFMATAANRTLTLQSGRFTVDAGTVTIGRSLTDPAHNMVITVPSPTPFTIDGAGRVFGRVSSAGFVLNAVAIHVTGGGIYHFNHGNGWGTAPASLVSDFMVISNNSTVRIATITGGGVNRGITIGEGGGTIQSDSANTISAPITGSSTLTKIGSSTLTVSADNTATFTGQVKVSATTLALSGDGSFGGASSIAVDSGATLNATARTDGTLTIGSSQILTGAGTVTGIVSLSGTVAPGNEGVGTLNLTGSQIWNSGGVYEWEMADATGAAGTGFDRLNITGDLDVQATEGDKFTVKVKTSGIDAQNFDNDSAADWPLASVSGSIQNYTADKFDVDYADVSNDLAGGTFEMHASELNVKFVPNQAPTASDPTMLRGFGNPGQIAIEELGSDPDGDALALVSFSTTTAEGATVSTDGTFLIYTPGPNGDVADEISYTIRDARNYRDGDTVRTASGTVSVIVGAAPPVITQQPTNQTVLYSSTAIFNVEASGTGTLLYQWRKGSENLEDAGNISGATTETLTVASLTFSDNGDYRVVVTDNNGAVTSLVAVLTVLDPYVTSDPVSVTTNAGATVTFTVSAIGSGTLDYQWTKDGEELSNGGNVSGATSATLTLSNASQTDAGDYAAIVSNGNSATSQVAVLIVIDPPSLDGPFNRMSEIGGTATFTVAASGIGPFTYQWNKGDDVLSENEKYSGVTDSALAIADVTEDDAGTYTVFVSNAGGTNSGSATLTVLPAGDRIWSGNGVTKGGAGTWDTSSARWSPSPDGPFELAWANSITNSAVFVGDGAQPGAVTVASPVTVNKITVTNASATPAYSFTGDTITFSGEDAGVLVAGDNNTSATNTVAVTAPLAGSVLNKSGGGRLALNNTGSSVGKWIVTGGAIVGSVNNSTAADALFGTGVPAEPVADFITLDGGGLGFSGTGANEFSLGENRGIYIGPGNGQIGSAAGSGILTIDGPITGPGELHFPGTTEWPGGGVGANSTFVLMNTNNNWEGQTRIATAEIRCGADYVFPSTTTLNLVSGSLNGRVNLNGTHQAVAKLIINSTTGNTRVMDSVGGGSLSADHFDLRGAGTSATATSAGVLAGDGYLTKTTAGIITLGGVNTYTGDTLIEEGTLALSGSGSINNSANITIALGATLSVTGREDGTLHLGSSQTLSGNGTVSGSVAVNGTLAPGESIGTLNTGAQIWNGGGTLEWEVANVTGAAGTDWDSLNITGGIDVQATVGNQFTIVVLPDGEIAGFDPDVATTWPIATLTGAIENFDAGKIAVNDSAVTTDLAGGVFVPQPGSGVLNLVYSPNPGPVASPRNISRPKGISVKIAIADLLAESTSHADGSPRELVSVGAAANGTVTTDSAFIYYTPNNDDNDSFTYTVKDVRNYRDGDTVQTAQSSINITVVNAVGSSTGVAVSGGTATASFAGIPGYSYEVQRSTDLENWVTLDTVVAPANGLFEFVDDFSDLGAPPASAFYRLRQP